MEFPVTKQRRSYQQEKYEDIPTIIYDHKAQILSADVLKSSSFTQGNFYLLASIDVTGTILVRNLTLGQDFEKVITTIKIPVNILYPKVGADNDNEDDDPADMMDLEYPIFKKNTVKLLYTQDKFMFEQPHDPPDLLLMQCEKEEVYGIRVSNHSCVKIPIAK